MTIVFNGTVLETGRRDTTLILLKQLYYAHGKWVEEGRPNSGDFA